MTRHIATLMLALALTLPAFANAASFRLIGVKELSKMMKDKNAKKPQIYDANNQDTRSNWGIIPGAKLLTSHSEYDVAKTLPQDKTTPVVFYCANEQCTASHKAAERASAAGYNNALVLSDGIIGWKKAGQPVSKAN